MRAFIEFTMRSRLHAVSIALIFSIIPFLNWVGTAVMGLFTLRRGPIEGLLIVAGVVIPLLVGGWFGGKEIVFLYAISVLQASLVVWFLALFLRRQGSWRSVLIAGVVVGSLFVAGLHLYNPDITVWWETVLQQYLTAFSDQALQAKLASPEVTAIVDIIAKLFTGIQVSLALLGGLFSLLIARWWQAIVYNPGGLGKELAELRLGLPEAGVAILVAVTGLFLDIKISFDLLPLLALLFLLPGIALVHRLIVLIFSKRAWIGLTLFYIVLVFSFKYVAMLLIALALLDSGLNFRTRYIHYLTKR